MTGAVGRGRTRPGWPGAGGMRCDHKLDPMPFAPSFPVMLRTEDGVRIDAAHTPSARTDVGIVVAHGFTGSWRERTARRIVHVLSGYGGVVAFDFRGHGRSGGETTVGDREILDVEAAVRHARVIGYSRIAVVGFSMGASVAVRHAGLRGGVDAVVAVSGPARWYYRGTKPMRQVHWAIERPLGRWAARVAKRTRIASGRWDPIPMPPHEAAKPHLADAAADRARGRRRLLPAGSSPAVVRRQGRSRRSSGSSPDTVTRRPRPPRNWSAESANGSLRTFPE